MIALRYRSRFDWWVRLVARIAPPFTWRWGWKSAYAIEQRSFARRLIRLLKADPCDVVHTQDVWLARDLQRAVDRRRIACRVVLAHGTDENRTELRTLRYLQHLSPPDMEAAAGTHALNSAYHVCIPNFVDATRFRPVDEPSKSRSRAMIGIPGDAMTVGSVAAIQRFHKRMDAVAPAIEPLAEAGFPVHVLMAGATTPDTPAIEAEGRQRLGVRLHVMKDVSFDNMPGLYAAMDVYFHPVPAEAFGICILEAMASGVPVVAHDCPIMRWIVGDGGWLTDVRRVDCLALLWDQIRAERDARGRLARARIEAMFSWDAVYPQFVAMYEAVGGRGIVEPCFAQKLRRAGV